MKMIKEMQEMMIKITQQKELIDRNKNFLT